MGPHQARPTALYGDEAAKLLVTRHLPGTLVEGDDAQDDPETYLQAGSLLAAFHGQFSVVDDSWNVRFRARVERHLALPHRIGADLVQCALQRSRAGRTAPRVSCPHTVTGTRNC